MQFSGNSAIKRSSAANAVTTATITTFRAYSASNILSTTDVISANESQ